MLQAFWTFFYVLRSPHYVHVFEFVRVVILLQECLINVPENMVYKTFLPKYDTGSAVRS